MRSWVVGSVSLLVAGAFVLTGCSTSPEALENAVKDEPGVVSVEATQHDGDDALPFQRIAKAVEVKMAADASKSQIMAVFDAYDDDIDDGDVYAVEVALAGPKSASLVTGEDIHATAAMVEDLVRAQSEEAVIEYEREATPVLPSVHLTLASGEFDEVVAVADRYRDAEGIESVGVSAGGFILVRDQVNDDLQLTAARERLVQDLAQRFPLRGALVAGRGPLRLAAAPSEQAALRRYVKSSPAARDVGRIVVRGTAQPPV